MRSHRNQGIQTRWKEEDFLFLFIKQYTNKSEKKQVDSDLKYDLLVFSNNKIT